MVDASLALLGWRGILVWAGQQRQRRQKLPLMGGQVAVMRLGAVPSQVGVRGMEGRGEKTDCVGEKNKSPIEGCLSSVCVVLLPRRVGERKKASAIFKRGFMLLFGVQ
jgi:hypothetical protein